MSGVFSCGVDGCIPHGTRYRVGLPSMYGSAGDFTDATARRTSGRVQMNRAVTTIPTDTVDER